jgi:hypothetical protein
LLVLIGSQKGASALQTSLPNAQLVPVICSRLLKRPLVVILQQQLGGALVLSVLTSPYSQRWLVPASLAALPVLA